MTNLLSTVSVEGPVEAPAKRGYLPASERRRVLLDQAVALIREDGWENLTMSKLAQRAGVSRQLVYRYFGNLEDLALELATQFQEDVYEATVTAIESHPENLEAAMRYVMETFLVGLREERLAYREFFAGHWPHPRIPRALKEIRAKLRHRLVDFWAKSYETRGGLTSRDARALSSFLYVGLQGVVGQVNAGEMSAEEAVDFAVRILRACITGLGGRLD